MHDRDEAIESALGNQATCPYSFEAPDFDTTSERHIADPYEFYRKLRARHPVFASRQLHAVVLSRLRDVRDGFKDHKRLSSKGSLEGAVRLDPEVVGLLKEHDATLEHFFANVDPPQHTRLRRAVARPFSVRSMARLEPRVQQETEDLLKELVPRGRADLVADFGNVLPARVTARFLGIPLEDTIRVHRWVSDWFDLFFTPLPPDEQRKRALGYIEYVGYMTDLLQARRISPEEDFMSEILAAVADGSGEVSEREIVGLMTSISLGGNDTTGNQIASLFYRLLTEPDTWAAVVSDPSLRANAIEESLRLDSAGIGAFRVAKEQIHLSGGTIEAGSVVFLNQDSANHDDAIFEKPGEYVIGRANAGDNIAFGAGIHHCLGAPLARMELGVVLDFVTAMIPTLRIFPQAKRAFRPSVIQRSMLSLPVEWDLPERGLD